METFTPIAALVGGSLIGIASVFLMLFNGRIAGVSGILGGVVTGRSPDRAWRIAFISGLVVAPLLYQFVSGIKVDINFPTSLPLLVGGGVLVGIGTRLGSGCTSGHGVCGVSRSSVRSVAATVTFMITGILTVFIVRHFMGGL